jgi:translation initiation factor 1A
VAYRKKKKPVTPITEEEEIQRIRMPKGNQIFGEVLQLHGDRRMKVRCSDGKERMCRVPGKLKRRLWVRAGNIVLVEPWVLEGDKKAYVIWRYSNVQANYIRRRGLLK